MPIDRIFVTPEEARCYSKLALDYIHDAPALKPFFNYPPELSSFEKVMFDKQKEKSSRGLLVEVLKEQYASGKFKPSKKSQENIELISQDNTFTVCTGHQPCLFTGPLYFIYKIISTISLASRLAKEYPGNQFVPVFWIAGEDHDFAEINHAHLFGKTLLWNGDPGMEGKRPPVGKIPTETTLPVMEMLRSFTGNEPNGKELFDLIFSSYSEEKTIADATRCMLDGLFGEYGLVCLDADDARLKKEFITEMSDDLFNGNPERLVKETISKLEAASYSSQVNPRTINCFYFLNGSREKIEFKENRYVISGQNVSFSADEIKKELELHPERFSPNVVLRPLYQEKILPNLAYIGGPAEIGYWFEYKAMFEFYKVNFPVLILRNSAVVMDENSTSKLNKMNIPLTRLFQDTENIIKSFLNDSQGKGKNGQGNGLPIASAFDEILKRVEFVDESLKPAVEAERQRYLNGLKLLEEKILRAKKKKEEVSVNQIKNIREKLFPDGAMQERYDNFIPLYLKYGRGFFQLLLDHFDPFEKKVMLFSAKEN